MEDLKQGVEILGSFSKLVAWIGHSFPLPPVYLGLAPCIPSFFTWEARPGERKRRTEGLIVSQ